VSESARSTPQGSESASTAIRVAPARVGWTRVWIRKAGVHRRSAQAERRKPMRRPRPRAEHTDRLDGRWLLHARCEPLPPSRPTAKPGGNPKPWG
jgi:hypothetical protein